MLVSPTEPTEIRRLGVVSSVPETWGCDILIRNGEAGIQRKTVADLIASVRDGRLAKELGQMQQLQAALLIVEGDLSWTTDGMLVTQYGRWTVAQHYGLLWSVQRTGVWVVSAKRAADTIAVARLFAKWTAKKNHQVAARPGPGGRWGQASNREWTKWLLQGIQGVGPELAERIVDKHGCPFEWSITQEDLMAVEGIGEKKAEQMMKALR